MNERIHHTLGFDQTKYEECPAVHGSTNLRFTVCFVTGHRIVTPYEIPAVKQQSPPRAFPHLLDIFCFFVCGKLGTRRSSHGQPGDVFTLGIVSHC